ncbi:Crp/Fnr family transcriptional regulator [Virgibacillus sp. FSP13]
MQRLDTDDYNMLIADSERLHVKKGELIFREGSLAENLYFISKGEIRIFKDLGEKKELTIFTRGEQDGFGEIGIFSGNKYSNTAQAAKNCELFIIKKAELEKLLGQNGRLGLQFTRWVAESLEESKARIRDFMVFGSEGAVASMFVRYSNMYGIVTPKGTALRNQS